MTQVHYPLAHGLRFNIGDKAWVGVWSSHAPHYETCPDCGGTGRLRVTFHDETQVSIECRNCAEGYDPPTGKVIVYRHKGKAEQVTISGFETRDGKMRWHYNLHRYGYNIADDDQVFDTEQAALEFVQKKIEADEKEKIERIHTKEKDTRTWAWNASYHRREIKEAQRRLEYHTAKLAVAALKAKEKSE